MGWEAITGSVLPGLQSQTMLVGEGTICFVQSRVLLGVSTPSCSMQVIVGSLFLLGVSTPSCSMQVIVGSLFLLGVSTPSCSMQVIVGSLFLLDRIMSPGWGPTGWGWVTPTVVVTPAVEATAQPNALRLNLNS